MSEDREESGKVGGATSAVLVRFLTSLKLPCLSPNISERFGPGHKFFGFSTLPSQTP